MLTALSTVCIPNSQPPSELGKGAGSLGLERKRHSGRRGELDNGFIIIIVSEHWPTSQYFFPSSKIPSKPKNNPQPAQARASTVATLPPSSPPSDHLLLYVHNSIQPISRPLPPFIHSHLPSCVAVATYIPTSPRRSFEVAPSRAI